MLSGLNWWRNQAEAANASLEFIVSPGHPIIVPTSYEPISRSTSDEGLWIDEAMTYLGYNNHSQSDYLMEVQDYVNDQRQALHTDWGVVIFIVDSSADPDGQFLGGGCAYVPNNGSPYFVMTYDNCNYWIQNMDGVLAHEIGHVFGSPEELPGQACTGPSSCISLWGYLSVPNQNCDQSGCARPDNTCIMRAPYDYNGNIINTTCHYTQGHVGWHDSDADGIPDLRDTEPTLTITGYPSSPSSSYILNYDATVMDMPWPTMNPNYIDVTINTMYVEYRIGSTGLWQHAIAGDGDWDSPYEEDFKIAIFQNGTFHIYLRAINEVGHTSTVVDHTVTINSADPIYRAFLPLVMRND